MTDKKLESPIPRRDFLKVLGFGALAGGLAACKKNPVIPEVPEVPVTYTGYMQGLFTNKDVTSGQLIFNGTTKVDISNGVYNILATHNLMEGEYAVRIETNEGFPRETRAYLSNSGLSVKRSGLLLDNVIEKNAIDINEYNNWLTGQGSERWLTYKPKFFLYDKSLWKARSGGGLEIIDNNYDVNPTTISSVETVVNNHVSQYTANFVSNPVLYKESNSSEKPDPNQHPEGWFIYKIREDAPFSITAGYSSNNGDIYNSGISFQPGPHPVAGISIDTAELLGIGQQHNSGQIFTRPNPSELAKTIAKIIYNRPPQHVLLGGIDKEL